MNVGRPNRGRVVENGPDERLVGDENASASCPQMVPARSFTAVWGEGEEWVKSNAKDFRILYQYGQWEKVAVEERYRMVGKKIEKGFSFFLVPVRNNFFPFSLGPV